MQTDRVTPLYMAQAEEYWSKLPDGIKEIIQDDKDLASDDVDESVDSNMDDEDILGGVVDGDDDESDDGSDDGSGNENKDTVVEVSLV